MLWICRRCGRARAHLPTTVGASPARRDDAASSCGPDALRSGFGTLIATLIGHSPPDRTPRPAAAGDPAAARAPPDAASSETSTASNPLQPEGSGFAVAVDSAPGRERGERPRRRGALPPATWTSARRHRGAEARAHLPTTPEPLLPPPPFKDPLFRNGAERALRRLGVAAHGADHAAAAPVDVAPDVARGAVGREGRGLCRSRRRTDQQPTAPSGVGSNACWNFD